MQLAASNGGGGYLGTFVLLGLFVVAFWFLLIRPQQRRRRELEQMQKSVAPGDEVLTIGGLYGTVVTIDDESVTLDVGDGVTNRYARGAVNRVVHRAADTEEEVEEEDDAEVEDEVDEDEVTDELEDAEDTAKQGDKGDKSPSA